MISLTNLKIAHKLPVSFIGVALAIGVAVGVVGYTVGSSVLLQANEEKLDTVVEGRTNGLSAYLEDIKTDLGLFAQSPQTLAALSAFSSAYASFGADVTSELQASYISNNPNATGEKHLLDFSPTGTAYDFSHEKYHPTFRNLLLAREYYDIFLFNTKGDLVYSVYKELDYATNFASGGGKWAGSDLGNAYRAALTAAPDTASFFDFKAYAPSADAPAAFISMPIYGSGGKVEGVAAFQMPISKLNAMMSDKTGLGETGETLIVGEDFLMRNDSAFTEEDDILATKVQNPMIERALEELV